MLVFTVGLKYFHCIERMNVFKILYNNVNLSGSGNTIVEIVTCEIILNGFMNNLSKNINLIRMHSVEVRLLMIITGCPGQLNIAKSLNNLVLCSVHAHNEKLG